MVAARTARITMSSVTGLRPGETLRDTELKGFGARRRQGAPRYFPQTRVDGRTQMKHDRHTRRAGRRRKRARKLCARRLQHERAAA